MMMQEQDSSCYSCDQEYFLDLCRGGELEEIKQFVESLAEDSKFDWQWITNSCDNFMHMISANNHHQVYDYLHPIIEKKLSKQKIAQIINYKNSSLNTPLHYAAINGAKQMIQRLIQIGADANNVNQFGKTALNEAQQFGFQAIAEILAPVTKMNIEQLKQMTQGLKLNDDDQSDQQQEQAMKQIVEQAQQQQQPEKQSKQNS